MEFSEIFSTESSQAAVQSRRVGIAMTSESVVHLSFGPHRPGNYAVRLAGTGRSSSTETAFLTDAAEAKTDKPEKPEGPQSRASPRQERQLSPDEFAKEALAYEPLRKGFQPVGELNSQERAELRELQARDAQVRAQEIARLGAAGALAMSGARFRYTTGPDGKKYATDGEVPINTARESDPQAALEKARRLREAALVGKGPAAVDLRLTAMSMQMALQASSELARQAREESGLSDEEIEMILLKEEESEESDAPLTGLMREVLSRYLGMASDSDEADVLGRA